MDATGLELPEGVVDLYVHALPDLIERIEDDLTLAERLRAAGFRGGLHRHHFEPTASRCRFVQQVTGFDLYGAILCNDTVGGLNSLAVEVALAAGAKWVGLPTLSAAHHQKAVAHVPEAARRGVDFAAGSIRLVTEDGRLLDSVRSIVDLADEYDVPVGVGYPSYEECVALLKAGRRSAAPFVLTNPNWTMGLSLSEVETLLGFGNVVVEITAYSLYRAPAEQVDSMFDRLAKVARLAGDVRMVLTSDSGITKAPPAPELMRWAVAELITRGFNEARVHRMITATPAELLGLR
ncbi:DUF6282 family protein [Rhodococcus sp. WAY2]|uniref:DUF6282 family protein n=1 Tax=Rhodococcus sp. WAY2 TaxID=2663121 RepID=UPI0013200846|nr:DUF6282 family protein [Rhodococcus sp. WAY2]QHE73287.1 hypothetical protein GFS60_06942 [Rhodococcus sp. WAY2]